MKGIAIRASERPVTRVKFNRDGDILFTAGQDGMVAAWASKDGQRLGTYHYIEECPFDATEQDILKQLESDVTKLVDDIDVTHNSSDLATARFDLVIVYDVVTGVVKDRLQESAKVTALEWNRHPLVQNKLLVAHTSQGGETMTIPAFKIYECSDISLPRMRSWAKILEINDFEGMPSVAAWGPLDTCIIGGTDSGKLYRWDLTGAEVCRVSAHKEKVTSISFNRDRSIMLTASKDNTAALWDASTFKIIKRYSCDRPLSTCAICPLMDKEGVERKPHMLLAGGQEASEVTTTAAEKGFFETLIVNMVYENEVGRVSAFYSPTTTVAYSPDGLAFAAGVVQGDVKIFKFDDAFLSTDHNK